MTIFDPQESKIPQCLPLMVQKASVTSGIGLGMSRTSSVVVSGGVVLTRPCLWTAKKARQMIETLQKMSNWCVRLGGP